MKIFLDASLLASLEARAHGQLLAVAALVAVDNDRHIIKYVFNSL